MLADDPRFPQLVHHLVVDFAGEADADHIRGLVMEVLEHGPREAYLAITTVSSLSAALVRAAFAEELSRHQGAGHAPFWGLEVQPHADLDMADPQIRCAIAAGQAMTAALNEDRDTAAAVVMAVVRNDDTGAEDSAHLLIASLRLFSKLYNSPEGRAGWDLINAHRPGGTDAHD